MAAGSTPLIGLTFMWTADSGVFTALAIWGHPDPAAFVFASPDMHLPMCIRVPLRVAMVLGLCSLTVLEEGLRKITQLPPQIMVRFP